MAEIDNDWLLLSDTEGEADSVTEKVALGVAEILAEGEGVKLWLADSLLDSDTDGVELTDTLGEVEGEAD